ncbi:MAG: UvrD-helicase domain-containing protein, partial [bacterium]|nr:UvrD-helicase domain-containing protein [bacterium]
MFNLSHLNKKQKQAVQAGAGPLLIVAGAGTGKTTVITSKVAYMIEKGLAKPEEILAVTFTDKAANEMLTRVDQLLSRGYSDLWISTFHSFCDRVLREEGLAIGLPTDFKLLDQTQSWLLLRQNFDKFKLDYYRPMGSPAKFLRALIEHFNRCKDQAIFPEDYLKYAGKIKTKEEGKRLREIASAYETYQKLLLENGFLDFGDLINYCLKLFKERPKILEKYRRQFKYILVDEFQDTNLSQYELVKILAAPKNNLAVCADANQAIYRWRGASFGNIINFKKDFPKAKIVFLEENYRSFQGILDLAFKFLKIAKTNQPEWLEKINKKLKAEKRGTAKIGHLHFKTVEHEVAGVVQKIIELMKADKNTGFNDFVILVRANSHAAAFTRAFERTGMPFQFLAMRGLYSKPIILDIISYFKFLDNYHESSSAFKILSLPFLGILPEDIAKISQYGYRKAKSIFEAMQELPLIGNVSLKTQNSVVKILAMIQKHTKMAAEKNVSEILLAFLEDSGYLNYLAKKERREDLELISQFHSRIKSFEETHLDARLGSFVQELNLELESGEEGKLDFDVEQGPDVVRIMTLHSAKGLEFKYVFLVNLVDKRFPTIERGDPIEIPEPLNKDIPPEPGSENSTVRRTHSSSNERKRSLSRISTTRDEDYHLQEER